MADSFYAGDAIRIEAEIRDSDDNLMTPDSVKVTITNPAGTAEVTETAMTPSSTGLYYYIWQSATSDPTGAYRVKVAAVYGSYTALVNPSLFDIIS